MTPAREQWGCGSCWVFAAVAVIETRATSAGSTKQHLSDQVCVRSSTPKVSENERLGIYILMLSLISSYK